MNSFLSAAGFYRKMYIVGARDYFRWQRAWNSIKLVTFRAKKLISFVNEEIIEPLEIYVICEIDEAYKH